jgi:L-alanine-DL-glutamate epimerase-like enolase superfamily enzyme
VRFCKYGEKLKASWFKYKLIFELPAGTSRGIMHEKDTWFLHIWDEQHPEIVGIGECSLLKELSFDDRPDYEEQLAWLCKHINDDPLYLKKNLVDWPSIRFGLETALADLKGGGTRILFPSAFTMGEKAIPINGLVWMGDKDFMLKQIEEKLKQGYTAIKLKVGAIDFESECALLGYIRKEYDQSKISIRLDANGAFSAEDVFQKLKTLSQYQIHSIEQPVAAGQPELMGEVCLKSPIPIALDEELIGIHSMDIKRQLLETLRPQYIILKPSLLGGFAACNEWISLAAEMNIGWWVTSALESNIGLNAIVQWTATLGNLLPQGLGTGSLYLNNIPAPLKVKNGFLHYIPNEEWDLTLTCLPENKSSGWKYPLTLNGLTLSGNGWLKQVEIWENEASTEPWLSDLGNFLKQWFSDDDFITVRTSGSTGEPKEIQIAKQAMIESAKATGEYLDLQNHPDALLCLSAKFIAGMMMVVRAMVYKQNLLTVRPDGNPLLNFTGQYVPSFAAMVPAQVFNSLNDSVSSERLMKIRTLIIGGGEIQPLLDEQLQELPGAVYATYGMTETITHVALRRVNGNNRQNFFEALPGIQFSMDKRNCLVINSPERNKQPFVTNDLVELISSNKFRWLGRFDNVINRGGEKIIPEAIEKKLAPHIQKRFFVAGIPDIKFGQVPVLFMEAEKPGKSEIARIEELLKQISQKTERPVRIYFVSEFEETENGKVNRKSMVEKASIE